MVRATKIRINKYKSEYIIKLVGIYICQKCILTSFNVGSKMGNITGGKIMINYINVNHLVRLYDVEAYIQNIFFQLFIPKFTYIWPKWHFVSYNSFCDGIILLRPQEIIQKWCINNDLDSNIFTFKIKCNFDDNIILRNIFNNSY